MKSGTLLTPPATCREKKKRIFVNESTTGSHPGRNENSSATPFCATSNRDALSQLSGFCVTSTILSRWRQIHGKNDVRHVILTEMCWNTSLTVFRYFRAPAILLSFFLFLVFVGCAIYTCGTDRRYLPREHGAESLKARCTDILQEARTNCLYIKLLHPGTWYTSRC